MTGFPDVRGADTVSERQIRKLDPSEHMRTKELYELVFSEDQGAFADYYYEEIASGNEIYAVTEGEKILSMLHLNFYDLIIGEEERRIPYIVAVATHPEHRRQGHMTALIRKAMEELACQQVPFAYLMPARKELYEPFDFRYISSQNQMEISVRDHLNKEKLEVRRASFADVPDLQWFSGRHLKTQKGTFAKRTESYYERMLLEQEASDGELAVLYQDGMICGWFYDSWEGSLPEVREAEVTREWEELLLPTIADCFRYDEKVKLISFPESLETKDAERKPLMMGRILDLAGYCRLVSMPEGCSFSVTDRLIGENNGSFCFREGRLERIPHSPELPEYGIEEILMKFPLPGPVFLNELV